QQHETQYFTEDLGNGIGLDMVLIPGGTFEMGSPETEPDRYSQEGPQHTVTVPFFLMGRYPVTQAQWQAVAKLSKVKNTLKVNPSRFPGANRPVERVSWNDAVEFCQRLARYTRREYRLPTEAEWEYACRAGTTTPFHFGETLTTDLANYRGTDNKDWNWSGSYGRGPKGIYREETIEVGSLGYANAFGLSDMHGNVWEWCADHWHDNYEGAPTDGRAWLNENENDYRILRGGSWDFDPRDCRSAYRLRDAPDNVNYDLGFRLVCAPART
ncbi:MAG: formylglycine-generating enzyme family protein, partial [Leptolyngbyaceae bacterium]|nr:formylglycine-generating enzyme family protein [Leptolyngbyaceae bacterium]